MALRGDMQGHFFNRSVVASTERVQMQRGSAMKGVRAVRVWLLLVVGLFSAGLWAAQPGGKGYGISPEPAWVQAQDYAKTVTVGVGEAIATLLEDKQVLLGKNKQRYYRQVLQTLTAAGLREVSELRVRFNPEYQRLTLHSIRVGRDGHWREVVRSARVRMMQREEGLDNGIHDGEMTAVLILEDVRVGDVVDYSYSLSGNNPIFGQTEFGGFGLNATYSMEKLTARLIVDGKRKIQIKVHNVDVTIQEQVENGVTNYRIERHRVPAVRQEDAYPPGYIPYAWLDYSEYVDWPAVTDWARGLYRDAAKDSPAVQALAKRLLTTSKNTEDFITKTLFFVQGEIRYLGLELGANTHLPNPPGVVLARRFGDCKDKALLISEVLKRGGVKAWPALVSTQYQGLISRMLPSPGAFDHVIVMVEHEGKRYWLDGTRLYQAGGLDDIGRTDYSNALLIGHPEQGLVQMYSPFEPSYLVEVEEHYYADDFSGPVRLTVETKYQGLPAEGMRHRFNSQARRDIERSYQDYYAYFLPDSRPAKPLEYEDDPVHNQVVVRETYDIGGYWKKIEKGLKAPVVLAAFADMLSTPRQIEREGPFYLGVPKTIRSNTYIHYPIDVGLQFDPHPTVIREAEFSYSLKDSYADRVYRHRAELIVASSTVSSDRTVTAISAIKKIRDNWEFSITIAEPNDFGYREYIRLRDRLQELAGEAKR